ncbi:MAG: hypothetical protein ACI97B_000609 [Verrucomicrobiales bacterium]|jgi:hypothetical protein
MKAVALLLFAGLNLAPMLPAAELTMEGPRALAGQGFLFNTVIRERAAVLAKGEADLQGRLLVASRTCEAWRESDQP